jgi:hypothetical protein
MPAAGGRQPASPEPGAPSPQPASLPALELERRARRLPALGHLGHGMQAGARASAGMRPSAVGSFGSWPLDDPNDPTA